MARAHRRTFLRVDNPPPLFAIPFSPCPESTAARLLHFSIFSLLCLVGLAAWQVRQAVAVALAPSSTAQLTFALPRVLPGSLPQAVLSKEKAHLNAPVKWQRN